MSKVRSSLFLFVALLVLPNLVLAVTLSEANKSYVKKDYDKAVVAYNELLMKKPDDELLNYNLGCALYAKGDYLAATENFQKALLAEDQDLESRALYNLANSKYRIAKSKQQTDLQSSIDIMRESLDYYKRAIDKDKENSDAKYNHEFVEKEIKQLLDDLKKQQQEQEKQKQEDSDQKDQEQDQNQDDSEDSQSSSAQQEQQESQSGTQEEEEEKKAQEQGSSSASESKDKQESSDEQEQSSATLEMSKDEAENLLDKFSMQESDELLKPKQEIQRRSAVFKDW